MPTLPTFTVTDAQAQRLIAAFGSIEAYKEWLKQSVVNYVLDKEIAEIRATFQASVDAKISELKSFLNS